MRSPASPGSKNITVDDHRRRVADRVIEFRMEVDSDQAVQDVKDAIDRIRSSLPADVETPIVTKIDIEGQAIMTFAVSAPNMTHRGAVVVRRRHRQARAAGQARHRPDRPLRRRRPRNPHRARPGQARQLRHHRRAVSQQLHATNANLGSGRSEVGDREQAIRTLGDAGTVAKLAADHHRAAHGPLRQARQSRHGASTPTRNCARSRASTATQVVTFARVPLQGRLARSASPRSTEKALDEIRADHPEVADRRWSTTPSFYTYGNYDAAIDTLLEGALLAVLVVLLFLRNWRATLISAVALPLSAMPTFWVMDLLGFSLNLVSFLAITLATGILVDDAIVEIENISRHIRMGKTPYRAAIEAAQRDRPGGHRDHASPSSRSSCRCRFMPGIPGQYFSQFGLTVAIAVLFSLLVARLITPMMAAYLMRGDGRPPRSTSDGWIMRGYIAAGPRVTHAVRAISTLLGRHRRAGRSRSTS